MKYKAKTINLNDKVEIHLITASGITAIVCDNEERAVHHWRLRGSPINWKIVRVTISKDDVTPTAMRAKTKPLRVVRTDDRPLALSA